MNTYTETEKEQALGEIESVVGRCEKVWPKFAEGTSQHSLLKNRIKALYIAKALISGEEKRDGYGKEELQQALAPIESIISKCEKARLKFEDGSTHYVRFSKMIEAMDIAKTFLEDEINKR